MLTNIKQVEMYFLTVMSTSCLSIDEAGRPVAGDVDVVCFPAIGSTDTWIRSRTAWPSFPGRVACPLISGTPCCSDRLSYRLSSPFLYRWYTRTDTK